MKKPNVLLACAFVSSAMFGQTVSPTPDSFYEKQNTIQKKSIPYANVSEADVIWAKRVYRSIDLREKFNQSLYYPDVPTLSNKSLFDVIKQGILAKEIYAFDNPIFDREYKTKMSQEDLENLFFPWDSTEVEDPYQPGTFVMMKIINELTSANIKAWWVEEDWFFNKQSGTMEVRINGLCPLREKLDPGSGEVYGNSPLFWVYFPQCQPILAKTEVYNTKNYVQRISYDDLFRKRMFSSTIFEEFTVNEKGNKIEEIIYNANTSMNFKITYKYDEKGNKIEQNEYDADESLNYKSTHKSTFKYDEKGNKIEQNDYDADGSLYSKGTYKYDEKGNNIEVSVYNADGSLSNKITFKYDEKGNMIERNEHNADGSLTSKQTYKYDEKGNEIEWIIYNADGSLISKYTYKYDEKGNKIE
jgi:gliding motility associated protien GldN